jgi:hypothetical protein
MKKVLAIIIVSVFSLSLIAQNYEKCASVKNWDIKKQIDPNTQHRKDLLEQSTQQWVSENSGNSNKASRGALLVIPVVVHVIYNSSVENVSEAQIQSQIDVLNADFRLLNADSLQPSHAFWTYTADSEIEFCLANKDPDGNLTSGITRTQTTETNFGGTGEEKNTSLGGKDNWEPTKYLNLWVCNLEGDPGTLGYSTFPSDLASWPEDDGVVIDYRAFGTMGTAGDSPFTTNTGGRTATHEVGHWLNLSHIWGDNNCGDDLVADTPPQEVDNSICPTFPHNANNSCGANADGEMFMNYMDYVDDFCMVMFSAGQKDRMWAAINSTRPALLTSDGCSGSSSVGIVGKNNSVDLKLYPSPSAGKFTINSNGNRIDNGLIEVYNVLGKVVYVSKWENSSTTFVNLEDSPNGTYFVMVTSNNVLEKYSIIINR